ncbi:MAG: M48 family metalloprotease [Actinomycetota bacterium]|nr:M48 family metalloprotease [Actinomycetota bacterium]
MLTLGVPLLTVLEPRERVALVAHELAHGRNGDVTRGLFVGSAVVGLAELYSFVAPDDSTEGREWELGLVERVANWFFWLLSRPVLGLLLLELHLLLRDHQRAEYLADALAARVAGTNATVSLHEKLLLESTFQGATQHAARGGSDLFRELREAFELIPEREHDRRRRVARLENARLGDTHPPTGKRITLLESRPRTEPVVTLDAERSAAIDDELAPLRPALERTLVDEYRDSLFHG